MGNRFGATGIAAFGLFVLTYGLTGCQGGVSPPRDPETSAGSSGPSSFPGGAFTPVVEPSRIAPPRAVDAGVIRAIRAVLSAETGLSGAVLIARDGVPQVGFSRGFSDAAARSPFSLDTPNLLASVSKQFTAALILRLEEQGRVDLGRSARTYLPELPASWEPITLHHLLTHTAGLPDYLNTGDTLARIRARPTPPAELVRVIVRQGRLGAPGGTPRYSNSGYALLGVIAERASGRSYAQALRTEVLAPAGLKGAGVWGADAPRVPIALGSPYRPIHPSVLLGCGNVFASATDLGRWDAALADGSVLRPETVRRMLAAQAPRFGYGFRLIDDALAWHTGHLAGQANVIQRYLRSGWAVIVLTNRGRYPLSALTARLGEAGGWTADLPRPPTLSLVTLLRDAEETFLGARLRDLPADETVGPDADAGFRDL